MILPLKWVIVIPIIQDDDCSCFKEISCNVCWFIGIWKGLRIRLLTVTNFRPSIRYFSHAHSLPNRAMQEMLLISELLRLTSILLSRMVFLPMNISTAHMDPNQFDYYRCCRDEFIKEFQKFDMNELYEVLNHK